MDDERLAAWSEQLLRGTEALKAYLLTLPEDDTCRWGAVFRRTWQVPAGKRPPGLLLTGPRGCGRHNTALHAAALLAEQEYEPLFLSGAELYGGAADIREVRRRVDWILDRYYDEGKPLCLVLDGWENQTFAEGLTAALTEILCEYRAQAGEYPDFFLILIADREEDVPPILRKLLRLMRTSLPDREKREEFLGKYAVAVSDYLSAEKFAELTEGFSYAQLRDAAENAVSLAVEYEEAGEEQRLPDALSALIREQRPEENMENVRRRLAAGAEKLMAELPAALAGGIAVGQGSVPAYAVPGEMMPIQQRDLTQETGGGQVSKKELEEMPVRKLIYHAFDRDLADSLSNADTLKHVLREAQ